MDHMPVLAISILLDDGDRSGIWPGTQRQRLQGGLQAQVVQQRGFFADAGAFAAFQLEIETRTLAGFEAEQFFAQALFGGKFQQGFAGTAAIAEQRRGLAAVQLIAQSYAQIAARVFLQPGGNEFTRAAQGAIQ